MREEGTKWKPDNRVLRGDYERQTLAKVEKARGQDATLSVCARSVCVRVSISRRVMGLRVGYIAAACGCIIYIAADSAIHADAYLRHRVDRHRWQRRGWKAIAFSESKWV